LELIAQVRIEFNPQLELRILYTLDDAPEVEKSEEGSGEVEAEILKTQLMEGVEFHIQLAGSLIDFKFYFKSSLQLELVAKSEVSSLSRPESFKSFDDLDDLEISKDPSFTTSPTKELRGSQLITDREAFFDSSNEDEGAFDMPVVQETEEDLNFTPEKPTLRLRVEAVKSSHPQKVEAELKSIERDEIVEGMFEEEEVGSDEEGNEDIHEPEHDKGGDASDSYQEEIWPVKPQLGKKKEEKRKSVEVSDDDSVEQLEEHEESVEEGSDQSLEKAYQEEEAEFEASHDKEPIKPSFKEVPSKSRFHDFSEGDFEDAEEEGSVVEVPRQKAKAKESDDEQEESYEGVDDKDSVVDEPQPKSKRKKSEDEDEESFEDVEDEKSVEDDESVEDEPKHKEKQRPKAVSDSEEEVPKARTPAKPVEEDQESYEDDIEDEEEESIKKKKDSSAEASEEEYEDQYGDSDHSSSAEGKNEASDSEQDKAAVLKVIRKTPSVKDIEKSQESYAESYGENEESEGESAADKSLEASAHTSSANSAVKAVLNELASKEPSTDKLVPSSKLAQQRALYASSSSSMLIEDDSSDEETKPSPKRNSPQGRTIVSPAIAEDDRKVKSETAHFTRKTPVIVSPLKQDPSILKDLDRLVAKQKVTHFEKRLKIPDQKPNSSVSTKDSPKSPKARKARFIVKPRTQKVLSAPLNPSTVLPPLKTKGRFHPTTAPSNRTSTGLESSQNQDDSMRAYSSVTGLRTRSSHLNSKNDWRFKSEADSIIYDLLYGDRVRDQETWDFLLNKLREEPQILSRLIDKDSRSHLKRTFQPSIPVNDRVIPHYAKVNTANPKLKRVTYKPTDKSLHINPVPPPKTGKTRQRPLINKHQTETIEKESAESTQQSNDSKGAPVANDRSRSAPGKAKKKSNATPTHEIGKEDPDWSKSVLESYVASGFASFNWEGDSKIFNADELIEFSKSISKSSAHTERQKFLFVKLHNTLGRLALELMLRDDQVAQLHDKLEGVDAMIYDCKVLIEAREATLKLLKRIKKREEIVLTLMTLGEDLGSDFAKQYKTLVALSAEILSLINGWKALKLPYKTFVYLGEDYTNKLHEDMAQLKALYRHKIGGRDDTDVDIQQADLKRS